jgi:hypothetical protein
MTSAIAMQWNPADPCERCRDPRKRHMPGRTYTSFHASGYSNGGGTETPVLAVTSGEMSSCVAFIEPGERVPLLTETLPPKSLQFFNDRWNQMHGASSKLVRPRFAVAETAASAWGEWGAA